jgi:5'-nucleotidase
MIEFGKKDICWVDMDDVLCDFVGAVKERMNKLPRTPFPQSAYGFFVNLKPMPGAIESYKELETMYDVRILTRPSAMNIGCYSEKALWVNNHLGFEAQEKMVLTCDKSIVKGGWLIDDSTNAGQLEFQGRFIHFGGTDFPDWDTVMKYMRMKYERKT